MLPVPLFPWNRSNREPWVFFRKMFLTLNWRENYKSKRIWSVSFMRSITQNCVMYKEQTYPSKEVHGRICRCILMKMQWAPIKLRDVRFETAKWASIPVSDAILKFVLTRAIVKRCFYGADNRLAPTILVVSRVRPPVRFLSKAKRNWSSVRVPLTLEAWNAVISHFSCSSSLINYKCLQ